MPYNDDAREPSSVTGQALALGLGFGLGAGATYGTMKVGEYAVGKAGNAIKNFKNKRAGNNTQQASQASNDNVERVHAEIVENMSNKSTPNKDTVEVDDFKVDGASTEPPGHRQKLDMVNRGQKHSGESGYRDVIYSDGPDKATTRRQRQEQRRQRRIAQDNMRNAKINTPDTIEVNPAVSSIDNFINPSKGTIKSSIMNDNKIQSRSMQNTANKYVENASNLTKKNGKKILNAISKMT